ncbi:hypothetical protein PVAR5_3937 [Paecilomyces variotii No. 5]|uniref:Uncharacterized protein n=1 Tax=Byssochlamys spectabilis (strain No. 5 / NBRC 109023) TaxID=1356009 RepID=V5HZ41_BYSSN|nr:hypothetical protein PVAR5_3937 [Paecilomyces variotii No. 5]
MHSLHSILPFGDDSIAKRIYDDAQSVFDRVYASWREIAGGDYDVDKVNQDVKSLKEGLQQYEKIYRDQQERLPLLLLSTIFKRLNSTQEINIDDSVCQMGYINEKGAHVLAWNFGYVRGAQWSGKKVGLDIATPWKLISDIFDCMEMSCMHPARFSLRLLGPPLVSRESKVSPEYIARVNHVLKDTSSIQVDISPLVENKCDGTAFLGDFLKAICDLSSLQELELNLSAPFGRWNMTSVFPLGKTTWTCLKSLRVENVEFNRKEFKCC